MLRECRLLSPLAELPSDGESDARELPVPNVGLVEVKALDPAAESPDLSGIHGIIFDTISPSPCQDSAGIEDG